MKISTGLGLTCPKSKYIDPRHISDIIAWYDISDLSAITQSAGLVSQVNDKSGNNHHLIQGTAINQPALISWNSKKCLAFNGTDSFMSATSLDENIINATSSVTIFLVCQHTNATDPTTGSSFNGIISLGAYENSTSRQKIFIQQPRDNMSFINDISNGSGSSTVNFDTSYNKTIFTTKIEAGTDGNIETYGGENSYDSRSGVTSRINTAHTEYYLHVGQEPLSGQRKYYGSIAEIIIYKRALTNHERISLTRHLSIKWGV